MIDNEAKSGKDMIDSPEDERRPTQLSEFLNRRMKEVGFSIKDLYNRLEGITYEHVRRVVRGEGVPSSKVLKLFCAALAIDCEAAERLATMDRIRKRYSSVPVVLATAEQAELEPVRRVWGFLSAEQKATVVDLVESMARRSKGTRK